MAKSNNAAAAAPVIINNNNNNNNNNGGNGGSKVIVLAQKQHNPMWQTGLFDCMGDLGTFAIACVAPCVGKSTNTIIILQIIILQTLTCISYKNMYIFII